MTNEEKDLLSQDTYRKLTYFFENKIKIHFKDLNEIFYNGLILNLDKEKNILVLSERVKGNMPILLEEIKPNSIREFINPFVVSNEKNKEEKKSW